jgi:RimJ/RimL family protein N-acetyltransferase
LSPADDGGRTIASPGAIETERLELRAIAPGDIELLVELDSDPEVMRYLNGGRPRSRAEVEDTLRRALGHRWMAFDRTTEHFVGWFGIRPTAEHERELGYRMRRAAWGKGLATEGSMALITTAFTKLGTQRIWAQTMTVNTRSRAVMERCGLRYVRTFFGDFGAPIEGSELGDVEYELTRRGWERSLVSG